MENIRLSDSRPAIVGVGNTLMGDDGVGPAAVEAFGRAGLGNEAELIDAGLAFSEVLCDHDPSRPMVIIDAVRGPGEPGSIYKLTPEELDGAKGSLASAISLHEVNVLPALQMSALAGRCFDDVTIFGVQPEKVEWGEGLSPAVRRAVKDLVRTVRQHLEKYAACAASGSKDT